MFRSRIADALLQGVMSAQEIQKNTQKFLCMVHS